MIGNAKADPRPPIVVVTTIAAVGTIAALLSACSTSPPGALPSPTSAPASPTRHVKHHAHALHGKITAERGTSWTVTAANNEVVTVYITSRTSFGSTTAPSTEQNFPVGAEVVVLGKWTGETVSATRIAALELAPAGLLPSRTTGR
jgi:hypothetical protein